MKMKHFILISIIIMFASKVMAHSSHYEGLKKIEMDVLRNWYLTAFDSDTKQNRLPYLMKSRILLQQMWEVTSDAYEEKEERMVPLLYKEALEKYYLMTLLTSVDELGYDADDFIFIPERIQPMT